MAWLAIGILLASLVLPFTAGPLARWTVRSAAAHASTSGVETAGDPVAEPLAPTAEPSSGVRALPLRTPGGEVDRLLTNSSMLDADAGMQLVGDLAAHLGIQSAIETALAVPFYEIASQVKDDGSYRYDPVDDIVAEGLAGAGTRDAATILDLSAVLTAMAASDGGPVVEDPWETGAMVAYSLLRQTSTPEDCDTLTNIAYLTGLGIAPRPSAVASATESAQKACGAEDPTPAWAEAKYLAASVTIGSDGRIFAEPPSRLRQMARDAFIGLQRDFPELPVGSAGEADLLLGWADASSGLGAQPFQARKWREIAAERYAHARTLSSDARLLVGHARALSGLDRHEEARQLLDEASELLGDDLTVQTVLGQVLARAGDHRGAAKAIAGERDARRSWWAGRPTSLPRADFLTGAYATDEYPPVAVWDAALQEFGGATVTASTFVPMSRHPAPEVSCREARRLDELLLAGRAEDVLSSLDGGTSVSDDGTGRSCSVGDYAPYTLTSEHYGTLALLALGRPEEAGAHIAVDAGYPVTGSPVTLSSSWDRLQDRLRLARDLATARTTAAAWTDAMPDDPEAWQRLAEIDYLVEDYARAVEELERSSTLWQDRIASGAVEPAGYGTPTAEEELAWVLLQLGAAQREVGDSGMETLNEALALTPASTVLGEMTNGRLARFHILGLMGQDAIDREQWQRAVDLLGEARAIGDNFADATVWGEGNKEAAASRVISGAVENNLALALARLGKPGQAEEAARQALAADPANPVYLDTVGFVLQKGGRATEAEAAYGDAEAADDTSYVSATNRAVLQARDGRADEAASTLLGVVAEHPDYALAWHNLGAIWTESWNPVDVLRGQGALGVAARLESDLRGADGLIMDEEIYTSGLDVARADAGSWQYGTSASAVSQRVTWSMVLLLLLRGLWVLGLDRVTGGLSERAMKVRRVRWSWWNASRKAHWAVALSIAVLAGPLLLEAFTIEGLWVLLALAGLVLGPLSLRGWAARRAGVSVTHRAWTPSLLVGGAGALVGFSFAPFPVMAEDQTAEGTRAVRWVAPVAVAALAVSAMAAAWVTGAPLVRIVAASALVLLASILTPVRPLDGALLRGRTWQSVVTLLLGAGTVALGLQWL